MLGVFINGVQKEEEEGTDFEILGNRIHLLTDVRQFHKASGARRTLLAVGDGVYDRGDQIDLQIHRNEQTEVVRVEATETLRAS